MRQTETRPHGNAGHEGEWPDASIPFAIGIDAQADTVEILSGRNGSRLVVPVGDWGLLTEALRSFDPQSLRRERPCLDLSE